MGRISRREIDVEANSIFFEVEADHPAVGKKAVGFANGQNRLIAQAARRIADCRRLRHELRNRMLQPGDILLVREADGRAIRDRR